MWLRSSVCVQKSSKDMQILMPFQEEEERCEQVLSVDPEQRALNVWYKITERLLLGELEHRKTKELLVHMEAEHEALTSDLKTKIQDDVYTGEWRNYFLYPDRKCWNNVGGNIRKTFDMKEDWSEALPHDRWGGSCFSGPDGIHFTSSTIIYSRTIEIFHLDRLGSTSLKTIFTKQKHKAADIDIIYAWDSCKFKVGSIL